MKEPECRWPFDSPQHRLIEKYIRVTRLHRSVIEHQLEGTGVYRSQHQILMYVSNNPNVSQKDLAKMYGVSGATIAVSLKKLEKGGYITRLADEADNRINQVSVTEKGKEVIHKSFLIFEETDRCFFDGFTDEEMAQFLDFMERAYKNMADENSRLDGEDSK